MDFTVRKYSFREEFPSKCLSRIETENETDVLCPYLYRMEKVTKIRIELFKYYFDDKLVSYYRN